MSGEKQTEVKNNLRRSGRVTRAPSMYLASQLDILKWTPREKEVLLEGLNKYGMKDFKFLSEEVLNGSKTPDQVKLFIKSERKRYHKECGKFEAAKESEIPLNRWISAMDKNKFDSGEVLSLIFHLFAQYEEHPDNVHSEIYNALSKVLNKEPIIELSESGRHKLIELVYKLRKNVQEKFPDIYSTIVSLESNRKFPFPSEVPSTSSACELLSSLVESNPLGLPYSHWNIPN
uniref:SANT domain-containing protein n=2 Tax=Lepeophtheirus salmonis TaxID=72036 RepID=A0A0K2UQZ5_LEPSM